MRWIAKLIGVLPDFEKQPYESRHNLRLKAPFFDQSFQLADDFSIQTAILAQKERGYFFFRTYGGRNCAVNFSNVHSMFYSEWPKIDRSTYEIQGIRLYFVSEKQYLEVLATADEISRFFSDLSSDDDSGQLGDWIIDKTKLAMAIAQ